jgi:hypothetical protein
LGSWQKKKNQVFHYYVSLSARKTILGSWQKKKSGIPLLRFSARNNRVSYFDKI